MRGGDAWTTLNFGELLPNGGRPAAKGSVEEDGRRRRARSLLAAAAATTTTSSDEMHKSGGRFGTTMTMTMTSLLDEVEEEDDSRRRRQLLANHATTTTTTATPSPTCAVPYFPIPSDDDEHEYNGGVNEAQRAVNEAMNRDYDEFNMYNPTDVVLIFYGAGVDLWSPEGMAATCEAEDAIMSVPGQGSFCLAHSTPSQPNVSSVLVHT